jgi:hypothetical protein
MLAEMLGQKAEVENAGKVATLLTVWTKLWEPPKLKISSACSASWCGQIHRNET